MSLCTAHIAPHSNRLGARAPAVAAAVLATIITPTAAPSAPQAGGGQQGP